jgi:hypothetical protein
MHITEQHKAIAASYLRSFIGAAVATYVATGDYKAAAHAFWAAALPVLVRYVNPKDSAFGRFDPSK